MVPYSDKELVLDIPTFLQAPIHAFRKLELFSLQPQLWIKVSTSIEKVVLNDNQSKYLIYRVFFAALLFFF